MAFGKKNKVKLNIFDYNIMVLGESKVGKTTLVYEALKKSVGENGYLFMELGDEDGAGAIEGINYINCLKWRDEYDEQLNRAGFMDVIDDIVENKNTEYKDLKVVVWDTYDYLIPMAEQEAIDLWNQDCRKRGEPEKKASSILGAWGGFTKGEKKALQLILDAKRKLSDVGVKVLTIGHTKTKDVTDIYTGETYTTLTSDQPALYFNGIKKGLHFLAFAYIDRKIVKEKTDKKDFVTKKDVYKSVVKDENRRIKFRDDNYAIDSGTRFAEIEADIPLDADVFIKTIEDAIIKEKEKNGVDIDKARKEQEKEEKAFEKRVQEEEIKKKKEKEEHEQLESKKERLISYIVENKNNADLIKPILLKTKELGYTNPKEVNDVKGLNELIKLIQQ